MKNLFLLAFIGIFSTTAVFGNGGESFFTKADAFFKANVSSSGGVYYASVKADPTALNSLVDDIASYRFSSQSNNTNKAFLINAYNILVIKNVVDHYPITKPLDVPGFFDQKKFDVGGMSLTLSDIENKKIRPVYKDARTHFVLVCAAKSCPSIANYAFMPSKLETQLSVRTQEAMDNRSFIKVNDENRTVRISQIFEWYADDFKAEARNFVTYINKYRSTPIPENYKLSFYTYDWALNEKKK